MGKGRDDVYLMYVLTTSSGINHVGEMQIAKLMRAHARKPALLTEFMSTATPATAIDHSTGKIFRAPALQYNAARMENVLGLIGRGLHFHHFREKWTGKVAVIVEFASFQGAPVRTRWHRHLAELSSELMAHEQKHGANPDVFFYQVKVEHQKVFRMCFYGGSYVTLMFGV
jgi:hypothetical protein